MIVGWRDWRTVILRAKSFEIWWRRFIDFSGCEKMVWNESWILQIYKFRIINLWNSIKIYNICIIILKKWKFSVLLFILSLIKYVVTKFFIISIFLFFEFLLRFSNDNSWYFKFYIRIKWQMDLKKGWICFDKIVNFIFYFNKSNEFEFFWLFFSSQLIIII